MKKVKGIILAGGSGTRLYPITKGISKQLLPIYDKPMIYYPLSVLMLANIRDILVISTPKDLPNFQLLLGSGEDLGIKISYLEQQKPGGLAEAFIIGKDFIDKDDVCLILGDNIFFGNGFQKTLLEAKTKLNEKISTIFGYYVKDPENFGVAELDEAGNLLSIEEKPLKPRSNYAVVGLYFYPNSVIKAVDSIIPSKRGELEITAVNEYFLNKKQIRVEILSRGFTWFDTGTHESLMNSGKFIESIEKSQGLKIACLEEIAFRMNFIKSEKLKELAVPLMKSGYGSYLLKLTK